MTRYPASGGRSPVDAVTAREHSQPRRRVSRLLPAAYRHDYRLAEVDPEAAAPAERLRALGDGRWELRAVIDAECQRALQQLRELLSHGDPHLTVGQLGGGWCGRDWIAIYTFNCISLYKVIVYDQRVCSVITIATTLAVYRQSYSPRRVAFPFRPFTALQTGEVLNSPLLAHCNDVTQKSRADDGSPRPRDALISPASIGVSLLSSNSR